MVYDPIDSKWKLPSFFMTGGDIPGDASSRFANRRERKDHEKNVPMGRVLLPALLLIAACDTALTVGRKTIGIRSGEFIYTDGYLRATYTFPFEKVWTACDKTLTDLKATDVETDPKDRPGRLTAIIQDEKVRISVDYVEKEMTAVSIMVGTSGNNLASQLIHDRIATVLKTP